MIATFDDLLKEYWLRKRNNGTLVWKTKAGVDIPIKDMTDDHLVNTINLLYKRKRQQQEIEDLEYDMREMEENASDDVLFAGWD